jgi:apolipoprotein N-acyltransferase
LKLLNGKYNPASAAILIGIISSLGFFPIGIWGPWLSMICLSSIYLILTNYMPHAARNLFLFMFSQGVCLGYWIGLSPYHYAQQPVLICVAIVMIVACLYSLYYWLAGWLFSQFRLPSTFQPWLFASLITLFEWSKQFGSLALPLQAFFNTQAINPILKPLFPLIGPFGVTWVTLLISATVVESARQKKLKVITLISLILLITGLFKFTWTKPTNHTIKISGIQANISPTQQWEQPLETAELYINQSKSLKNTDLIIWPEGAAPIPSFNQPIKDINTHIIYGTFAHQPPKTFNAIALNSHHQVYLKHHLIPLGEYTPNWLKSIGQKFHMPLSDLSSGPYTQPPFVIHQVPTTTLNCLEITFADRVRHLSQLGHIILLLTNDAWFEPSWLSHLHRSWLLSQTLALQKPTVFVNNSGLSTLFDANGQIIQVAKTPKSIVSGIMTPRAGLTPYGRWGNSLLIFLMIAYLLALMGCRRKRD